ncbi:MAG: hypothetical protein JNK82_21255 [Myxococcaceae bacterium]|nr:hypothetical protein [Myxococcaceae bacterium]
MSSAREDSTVEGAVGFEGLEALREQPKLYLSELDPHLMFVPVLRSGLELSGWAEVKLYSSRELSIDFELGPYLKDGEALTRWVTTLTDRPNGLFVACALTERLTVTLSGFTQAFAKGRPVSEVEAAPAEVARVGMTIDAEIFGALKWERARLRELLEAFAKVFPGTKLKLTEG